MFTLHAHRVPFLQSIFHPHHHHQNFLSYLHLKLSNLFQSRDTESADASKPSSKLVSGEDGTSVNFTGSDGKPGNAPETTERQERMEERTARLDAPDDDTSTSGDGKSIVCTEMYRQTQRDDWAQAMKTWYI